MCCARQQDASLDSIRRVEHSRRTAIRSLRSYHSSLTRGNSNPRFTCSRHVSSRLPMLKQRQAIGAVCFATPMIDLDSGSQRSRSRISGLHILDQRGKHVGQVTMVRQAPRARPQRLLRRRIGQAPHARVYSSRRARQSCADKNEERYPHICPPSGKSPGRIG